MLRRMLLLTSLLCFLVLATNLISAQIDTGEITGTVTDRAGAVVADATITLTNDETSIILSTKSTSTGTYSLNDIRPEGDRLVTPAPATSTVPTPLMVSSGFTNLQDLITSTTGNGIDARAERLSGVWVGLLVLVVRRVRL